MSLGLHLRHFHLSYRCQSLGEMPPVSCWTMSITYYSVIYIYLPCCLYLLITFCSLFFLVLASSPLKIPIPSSINLLAPALVYKHSLFVWEHSNFPVHQCFPSSGIFYYQSTFLCNWKNFVNFYYFCYYIYILVCVYISFLFCLSGLPPPTQNISTSPLYFIITCIPISLLSPAEYLIFLFLYHSST